MGKPARIYCIIIIINNSLTASIVWWRDLIAEEADNLPQDDVLAVAFRSSVIVMSVKLLMSDQILCSRPPPSTVLSMMLLQRLMCRVTWPNNA